MSRAAFIRLLGLALVVGAIALVARGGLGDYLAVCLAAAGGFLSAASAAVEWD